VHFILHAMESDKGYQSVLADAQSLGYAEDDPTADVEGHDAFAKLSIVARLAFGADVRDALRIGISGVTSTDVQKARNMGCVIRHVCEVSVHDGCVRASCMPAFCPSTHDLVVSGPKNAVMVNCDDHLNILLQGEGAGGIPTANSVVSDILDEYPKPPTKHHDDTLTLDKKIASAFYVRIHTEESLVDVLGACEFRVASITAVKGGFCLVTGDNTPHGALPANAAFTARIIQ